MFCAVYLSWFFSPCRNFPVPKKLFGLKSTKGDHTTATLLLMQGLQAWAVSSAAKYATVHISQSPIYFAYVTIKQI